MEPIFELKTEKNEKTYGKFIISPLAAGYGHTLGVALRRVLLTSMKGAAITTVEIDGVKHQFTTLSGMQEDVLDFLLNLKKVAVSYTGTDPVKATLKAKDAGEVKAGDIELPAGVTIANPELVLANLAKGAKLNATLTIGTGVGYLPADEREQEQIGIIPLDASFSPVVRVTPKIEETRVGRVTNYDKLTLEIWTNGTVEPEVALHEAATTLVSYFDQVVHPREASAPAAVVETESSMGSVGKLSVEELGLPTRVSNALAKAGFETVEKLTNAPRTELMKVRNLGEKSLDVINDLLKEKGVQLQNA
jgi:DNA-directed RNA polymerase subunit alpha